MIEIPFSNGNTYLLKNRWEELTPDQYKSILDYIALLMNGDITIQQLRIKTFFILSGQKPHAYRNRNKSDQQAENVYRMAFQMNFMLRVEYENSKALTKLKKATRDLLTRYLPEELSETPEVRWASKAVNTIKPDLVFAKNLIPSIGRRLHQYKGYTFEVEDNILMTSLTTSQFIDAQTVALEIQQTGSESLLNLLVAILYSGNFYSALQSGQTAKTLGWLNLETKKAIFINFNAIQTYLTTRTKYAILFNDSVAEPVEAKHNLGLGSVAHSLIKAGYGDIDNSNLVKFFEIMYSDLVNNVVSLHKQGNNIDKISEMTGLSLSKINQIL